MPANRAAMKTFTSVGPTADVHFKIDDDTFVAVAPNKLPAEVLIQYAEDALAGQFIKASREIINGALVNGSSERFLERLGSKEEPITFPTMVEVAKWLVGEVYGGGKGLGATS